MSLSELKQYENAASLINGIINVGGVLTSLTMLYIPTVVTGIAGIFILYVLSSTSVAAFKFREKRIRKLIESKR
jgi:uncharacterized protein (DUF2062 family)